MLFRFHHISQISLTLDFVAGDLHNNVLYTAAYVQKLRIYN